MPPRRANIKLGKRRAVRAPPPSSRSPSQDELRSDTDDEEAAYEERRVLQSHSDSPEIRVKRRDPASYRKALSFHRLKREVLPIVFAQLALFQLKQHAHRDVHHDESCEE